MSGAAIDKKYLGYKIYHNRKREKMRRIDDRFINDLLDGELSFFLQQVKSNDELCLAVRDGYINIYYRGGNLLKILQKNNGYKFFFDSKYCLNKGNDQYFSMLSSLNKNNKDDYIVNFSLMMCEMDSWFFAHPKAEREFQHNLLKSNVNIIDIEYQIKNKSRFDMLLFYKNKLVVIENKFGGGAITGKAGVSKHYQDICSILAGDTTRNEIIQSVVSISAAKHKLGLIDYKISTDDIEEIEVLFLFADFNPNSKAISNEVKLINKSMCANVLFMDKGESQIDYNKAEDLFACEN